MQFVYHENAGETLLHVELRAYEHLFKVRRLGVGDMSTWRTLSDGWLHTYSVESIGKKEAMLRLKKSEELPCIPLKNVHLAWCVIDPKIIEKTLPMLNELGVSSIRFVYADFSQKNHKLDYERMRRIVINSCQQCGRTKRMVLEEFSSVSAYLEAYPKTSVIDFCETPLDASCGEGTYLIGPEGGFSAKERQLLKNCSVVGFTCNAILRSETAVVSVAAKILA
jgi:16S rRNA (uracil1498-N3)-methyltransferase